METKQLIRNEIFKRRKAASEEAVIADSHTICQTLTGLAEFSDAEWIYLYIDCKNEVMTGEIMEEALRQGKRIAAPKVIGKDMIFYEISSREDLEPGYFGIPEPREGLQEATGDQGLLLMPGVAFDAEKHRAGYGGGFYDRYLEKHTGHFKAAVAFEFQMMEEIPVEPTDILPDVLITEKCIYR